MADTSPFTALFQPFQLKGLTLKNRIISTSHAPSYADNGFPGERYQRYHEEKARGGLAMTMFGGASSISPDSPPSFGQLQVGNDEVIPYFQAFASKIHAYGVGLICQLSHAGRRTGAETGNWLPALAPSPVREPAHGAMPKAMDHADIERVIADYAAAARRCQAGGLDGCELLISGHLIGQFWTPHANQRSDEYGGSLENRVRFGLRVLRAIRDAVGVSFIVGIRFPADELVNNGISESEGIEIACAHADAGLVDYLNVSGGANWTKAGVAETVPSMAFPHGRFIELAGRVKRATGLPVLHAAGVADLATANYAVAERHVDLIGMTRAHIADPHLVNKHLAGDDDAIRPCVGAGYCIDRIYRGGDALCLHNPASGRELVLSHTVQPAARVPFRVTVVGAGPAGLESARISAERGHTVTLLEAQPQAGGQLALAARLPWRKDLGAITSWLLERCNAAGVHVRFNVMAEVEDIVATNPDIVIIATGGLPNMSTVAGAPELAESVWDVLATPEHDVRGNVLVFDDTGGHGGASAAQVLAAAGYEVELATPDRAVAEGIGVTNHAVHLRELYSLGVRCTPDARLTRVEMHENQLRASLTNEYSQQVQSRIVDRVVIDAGTLPLDETFQALAAEALNGEALDLKTFMQAERQPILDALQPGSGRFALFRVGDAVSGRGMHAAMLDATRLCSQL